LIDKLSLKQLCLLLLFGYSFERITVIVEMITSACKVVFVVDVVEVAEFDHHLCLRMRLWISDPHRYLMNQVAHPSKR
jgi:hypothetical protein